MNKLLKVAQSLARGLPGFYLLEEACRSLGSKDRLAKCPTFFFFLFFFFFFCYVIQIKDKSKLVHSKSPCIFFYYYRFSILDFFSFFSKIYIEFTGLFSPSRRLMMMMIHR